MTGRQMDWERIGNYMAIAVAVLLASVIVGLAQTPETLVLTPPPAVKIELIQPKPQHALKIPGAISQSDATGDALQKLAAEHRCLAEMMYFEARGEGEAGEHAVARVILNRLAQGSHGDTICRVVYEGAGQTFCQFAFVCDGSLDRPKNPEYWREAQVLAARLLVGERPANDATDDATYFHSASVHPTWAPKMERVAQVGNHVFYRAKTSAIRVAFRGPQL